MAEALAGRLQRETASEPREMVSRAYRLAIGREPTEQELELSLEFLREQPLREFALAIYNLNEFLYVR
jgi:hypothetical protein